MLPMQEGSIVRRVVERPASNGLERHCTGGGQGRGEGAH